MSWWTCFFYVMIGIIISLSSNSIIDAIITIVLISICVLCITEIRERQTLQDRNYRIINNVLKNKKKEN